MREGKLVKQKKKEKKQKQEQRAPQNGKKIILKSLFYSFLFVVVLVFLVLSLFVGVQAAYADQALPGTKVAGFDVSGKTKDEIRQLLQAKLDTEKNNFKVIYEGKEWPIDLASLDINFDVDGTVYDVYNAGRDHNMFFALYNTFANYFLSKDIAVKYSIDDSKLDKFITNIGTKINDPVDEPTFKIKKRQLISVEGKEGLIVDFDYTKNILKENFSKLLTTSSPKMITDPVKLDDDDLAKAHDKAEIGMAKSITLKYGSESWKISADIVSTWIAFTPKKDPNNGWYLDVSVSSKLASEYLRYLFRYYARNPSSRVVIKQGNTEIVLFDGVDGFSVNFKKTATAITNVVFNASLKNKIATLYATKTKRGTVYLSPSGAPSHSGHAIVVKLSQQTVYCYDDGKLVKAFYCSSGVAMFPTPQGVFSIYGKTRLARMRNFYGPGNPLNYDLPNVPFVCWFHGDYSLHGTYWHNNFGYPMSHGCVNLATPNAEWLYYWSDIGDPVYVY